MQHTLTFVAIVLIPYIHCTCRGLLLGGGGDKAAYQAGVIKALVELDPRGVAYDVVVGISGGALNAATFAKYNIDDEMWVSQDLVDLWSHIRARDMYQMWPSPLISILKQPSMLDTAPQHKFVNALFNPSKLALKNRQVYVSVTKYETFENELISSKDSRFLNAVVASSAFPGIYPPVKLNDTLYLDGAFNFIHPIQSIVDKCIHAEAGSRDVHIDIIVPNGDFVHNTTIVKMPTLPAAISKLAENMCSSVLMNDYHKPLPGVKVRMFKPSKPLEGIYLTFTNSLQYIKQGYDDTVNLLKA